MEAALGGRGVGGRGGDCARCAGGLRGAPAWARVGLGGGWGRSPPSAAVPQLTSAHRAGLSRQRFAEREVRETGLALHRGRNSFEKSLWLSGGGMPARNTWGPRESPNYLRARAEMAFQEPTCNMVVGSICVGVAVRVLLGSMKGLGDRLEAV